MRIAYLDCFSGISGDMFLGALLDCGVPARVLEDAISALNLGATLESARVLRSGVSATKLDVVVDGEKDLPREVFQARKIAARKEAQAAREHDAHEHGHAHEHKHEHSHDHAHDHGHEHVHEHAQENPAQGKRHSHGRSLKEIRSIITGAAISETARQRALAIFENLGKVEARIHNVPVEDVHFHEAGSVDAIVDIVGAAVGAEALAVDEWVCSPLNVGGGTVECAHGTIMIPSPATVGLLALREAPAYSSGIQKELVTPTGAAIVSVLASRFGPFPAMRVTSTGYGAGYRDPAGWPNVLRITVGEAQEDTHSGHAGETVTVLETNIDDLSPQVFGYLLERLLAEGALDAFATPVQMKKSRPGLLLTVLCNPAEREKLARLIFHETTTIGIRMREEQRSCLARRHVVVSTAWGDVRMKLAHFHGELTNYSPEYEDCRCIALEHQVPLKTVMHEAVRLYLERKHEQ